MMHLVIDVMEAVIQTYEARGLPVAPNLIRAMLWMRDNRNTSLDRQMNVINTPNIKNNPDHPWHRYKQDIKKYLLFS